MGLYGPTIKLIIDGAAGKAWGVRLKVFNNMAFKTHFKRAYTERHVLTKRKPTDDALLKLWKEIALIKARNFCEYPGCIKSEYLNVHHIYSRNRRSVRYDPDNAIVLCAGHHTLNNDSAHKSPDFKETIIAAGVRTREFWNRLEMRAKSPAKLDLNLVKLDLLNELKKLS